MKKLIYALMIGILIPFHQSCSSDNDPILPSELIILDQKKASFKNQGGTINLTFQSFKDYTIKNDLTWCSTEVEELNSTSESGFKAYTLHLTVDKNYTDNKRVGTIKIIAKGQEYPIEIIQHEGHSESIVLKDELKAFNRLGGEFSIPILSYSDYSIEEDMGWCTVEVESSIPQDDSDYNLDIIKVTFEKNIEKTERSGILKIKAQDKEYPIGIFQEANLFRMPRLGNYQYDNIDDHSNQVRFDVDFYSTAKIHPQLQNKIFAHQLLDIKTFFEEGKIEHIDYDYPESSFTTAVGSGFEIFENKKPSLELQKEMEEVLLSNLSNQSSSFGFNSGQTYASRKELHFAGLTAFGLELDQLMGASYKTQELADNRMGCIFEYKHIFTTLVGDNPSEEPKLPSNIIETETATIGSISYGRYGYLVAEIAIKNSKVIKSILQKIARSEKLTDEDDQVIADSHFGYIRPGIGKYDFSKGRKALDDFYTDITKAPKEFCIPIEVSLHSVKGYAQLPDFRVSISE